MGEAKLYKGRAIVAYVNDEAVDSEGKVIEGAPKQSPDTDPSKQPHALAALNTEERSAAVLANAFATALRGAAANSEPADTETADTDALPTIKDLPDAVAKLKTVAEVNAMAKRDERVSAEPIYDARIAEIEAQ